MHWIDTHSHIYLDDFKEDRQEVIDRALRNEVREILLPNIDSTSYPQMTDLMTTFPTIVKGMIGLHPGSVKENWREELAFMESKLNAQSWVAIGEIGMDLYWDKTFIEEQKQAFRMQIDWAKEKQLPIVIHAREAFQEIFDILDEVCDERLSGVFHCFTGGIQEVEKIKTYPNFYYGIGGVATYKKAALDDVIREIPKDRLILETDAPYLSPVPYRGKRNESSYLVHTAEKVADVLQVQLSELAKLTTSNARELFKKLDLTQP